MNKEAYWKKNLSYLTLILVLWFVVGILCSILFVEKLNTIKIYGFPMGFWFATQGAILFFVILVALYIFLMNRLDKQFDLKESG